MSDIKKIGFLFSWQIENFSYCRQKYIASPSFPDKSFSHYSWHLVLDDICESSNDDGYIRCKLDRFNNERDSVVDFKIEVIGPSGRIFGEFKEKDARFNNGLWLECDLVKRADLIKDILESNRDIITVRCHIYGDKCFVDPSDCTARTKVIVNRQSLQMNWTNGLELKELFGKGDRCITDKYISFPDMTELNVLFEKKSGDLKVTIDKFSSVLPQYVEYKICLIDVHGQEGFCVKNRHFFSTGRHDSLEFRFINISILKNRKCQFVKNGIMIILCEFFCPGGIESQIIPGNGGTKLVEFVDDSFMSQPTLQSDLHSLFSNEMLCDVKLRVNDDIVQAHKLILASRSPVFNTMFQQDMLETQTGVVDIQDLDIDTLKKFLNFLYSDTVDKMDYNCAKNLLIAAEKYQVLGLKEICAAFLKHNLHEQNACEVATYADMVGHADLKSFALGFIVDHSKDILQMPEWLKWMKNHMELATEIFQKLTEKISAS